MFLLVITFMTFRKMS